jgi:hypothetical protein
MTTLPPPFPSPKRHGCLTALLIFMLFMNSVSFLFYIFLPGRVLAGFPQAPSWIIYPLAAGCAFNVFLTVSLFRWKKWAFYAFCAVASIMFFVNLSIGVHPLHAISGLLGPALLYGVLQIGGADKGWPHLK